MKGSLKTVQYLFRFVWERDRVLLFRLFLEQLVAAMAPIVLVVFPKLIIDQLTGRQDVPHLIMYVFSFAALTFAINFFGKYLWKINFVRMEGRLRFQFDQEIGRQTASLEYGYLEMPEILDLKEKAHKSMYSGQFGQFAGALVALFKIISQAMVLLALSGMIATLSPWLLILLAGIFFVNYKMNQWSSRRNYDIAVEKTPLERKSNYWKNIMGDFAFGKEIRINDLTAFFSGKYAQSKTQEIALNRKSYRNQFNVLSISAITALVQMVAVYGYLIAQVVYKALSIGNFTMYFSAIAQFAQAVDGLVGNVLELNRVGYTLADLERFMALEKASDTGKTARLPSENLEFEFENVSFAYPGSGSFALKNLNLKISCGEKLSIVGFNGAGKTTFVKLLSRLYRPTGGRILLNGIDINCFDFKEYMDLFSIVFQDFKLFSFTLGDNITAGKESRGKTLDEVIDQSGLKCKIENLPNRENTYIYKIFDETGIEPSGGEGQKIAIARALYKNSPVVILDEPTAALDPLAEHEIYRALNDLAANKTAIYISHRLSSTRFCDKVAVFENGGIVEYGSHDSLMEQNGLYADLYKKQAHYYVST